jgi:hypothetical protein
MPPAARAASVDSPPRTPPDDDTPGEAEIADEEPMTEVPRLPSMDERRATGSYPNVDDTTDTENDTHGTDDDDEETST